MIGARNLTPVQEFADHTVPKVDFYVRFEEDVKFFSKERHCGFLAYTLKWVVARSLAGREVYSVSLTTSRHR